MFFVSAEPRANPWDAGLPKSVIRLRRAERKNRLSLLGRLNERRCADPYAATSNGTASSFETSLPTSDFVYFLTSCLRSSKKDRSQHHHRPFAVDAWPSCRRAVCCWPDKRACNDADGPSNYRRHPTDVLGGLYAAGLQQSTMERLQSWYGPEASFCSREMPPKALRDMLFSPVDCVEHFSTELSK